MGSAPGPLQGLTAFARATPGFLRAVRELYEGSLERVGGLD
jgi:hypothetical protein